MSSAPTLIPSQQDACMLNLRHQIAKQVSSDPSGNRECLTLAQTHCNEMLLGAHGTSSAMCEGRGQEQWGDDTAKRKGRA